MIKWINALIGKGSRSVDDKVPRYFTGKPKEVVVCAKCYREHWAAALDFKDEEFVCPQCTNGKEPNETNV